MISESDRMLPTNPQVAQEKSDTVPEQAPVVAEIFTMLPVGKTPEPETEIAAVEAEQPVATEEPADPEEKQPSGQELAYTAGENPSPTPPDLVSENDIDFRGMSERIRSQLDDGNSSGGGPGNNGGGGNTDPDDPEVTPGRQVVSLAEVQIEAETPAGSVESNVNVESVEQENQIAVVTDIKADAASAAVADSRSGVEVTPPVNAQPNWYSNAIAGSVTGLIGGVSNSPAGSGGVSFRNNGRVVIRNGGDSVTSQRLNTSSSSSFPTGTVGGTIVTTGGSNGGTVIPGASSPPVSIPSTTNSLINGTGGLVRGVTGINLP
ncbi:MAG: hypothetical protein P1V20_06215 [Verrucomicrobiales bacterium]|nr:hypothetical protein [Verrucomicrobiales bacterium]